jgi:hypothetical protein
MQAMDEHGHPVGSSQSFGPIMTDRRPPDEPVPTITWAELTPAWLQTNHEAMDENSFIASLYEGRPHAEGARLERDYRQQVETAKQVEAAKRRSTHARG